MLFNTYTVLAYPEMSEMNLALPHILEQYRNINLLPFPHYVQLGH